MVKQEIKQLVEKAVKELQKEKELKDFSLVGLEVSYQYNMQYGDYTTNFALRFAKDAGKTPFQLAELIVSKLGKEGLFKEIKIVNPGFINFYLSKDYLQKQIKTVLGGKDSFGNLGIGKKEKVQVEFVSANPTGPLTLGNGRGGFCGDVLANVLSKAGYKVEREYYINDMGEQIRKLGHSVLGDEQAVYRGDYILALKKKIKEKDVDKAGQKAAKIILEEMIKPSIKKMGISFDVWFSEKKLHKENKIEQSLELLKEKNLSYEKDKALWFKSTKFGDDKDRVLKRENKETTYIASDIAYLKDKFERGFKKIIYFWGADHYGYINRMKAVAVALGYKKEQIKIIIMQMVRLMEKGKEVKMSKRAGIYVTIDELIDEVGLDVARFFFLNRDSGSHLNFDLALAKEKSERNPIYYVQYAFARICSVLKKLGIKEKELNISKKELSLLEHVSELELIKQLVRFPEIISEVAETYQIQIIPQYAVVLAASFHRFYRDCTIIKAEKELRKARLALLLAAKTVLENTLSLMGISAPEKM